MDTFKESQMKSLIEVSLFSLVLLLLPSHSLEEKVKGPCRGSEGLIFHFIVVNASVAFAVFLAQLRHSYGTGFWGCVLLANMRYFNQVGTLDPNDLIANLKTIRDPRIYDRSTFWIGRERVRYGNQTNYFTNFDTNLKYRNMDEIYVGPDRYDSKFNLAPSWSFDRSILRFAYQTGYERAMRALENCKKW